MKRSVLRSKLSNLIQDSTYDSDQLNDYLYRADLKVAGMILLPDFKRVGSVSTVAGQPWVNLASNLTNGFNGRLVRVHKEGVTIFPSLDLLIDAYNDTDNEELTGAGEVEAVAQEGNILWYQYVPETAESLVLTYYQNPPSWSSDNYEPSHIPEDLQYSLLVQGAAWMIYSEIEDDIEDVKINTTVNFNYSFAEDKPYSGINHLRAWVSRTRIPHISSCWSH